MRLQRFRGGAAGHRFKDLDHRAKLQGIDFPPVLEAALRDGKAVVMVAAKRVLLPSSIG
jgi:hypothetical protein